MISQETIIASLFSLLFLGAGTTLGQVSLDTNQEGVSYVISDQWSSANETPHSNLGSQEPVVHPQSFGGGCEVAESSPGCQCSDCQAKKEKEEAAEKAKAALEAKFKSTLTGDWCGLRTCMAEKGIIYEAYMTNFYQGVTRGGTEQRFRWGAKIDQYFVFESEKMGLWKGGSLLMHVDSQLGQSSIADAALLAPVNSAMLTPVPGRDDTAITNFQLNQELGRGWTATAGKYNFLDLWSQLYPEYGKGLDGFMNTGQIAPMNVVPTLPVIFDGFGFLKAEKRGVTAGVMAVDTRETQTVSGISGLYSEGVTVLGLGRVFTDFGGLPGSHLIAGTYATGTFTDFDAQGWLIFRDIGRVPLLADQEGSWLGAYVFDQKLWIDPCNDKRSIGLWGMAGWSDPQTSPYDWTMNVSIETYGPTARRQHDRAGIGYFYQGLSQPFTDAIGGTLSRTIRDVQGGEVYYNYQVTPWFNLTTDVQVVQPEFADQDTAWVFGLRGKITL